jgi:hypothetical protein
LEVSRSRLCAECCTISGDAQMGDWNAGWAEKGAGDFSGLSGKKELG